MESPLSQEYIYMPKEDIRCQTEVLYRARLCQVNSSNQVNSSGLTTNNLQLRKVISPSFNYDLGVLGLYGKPIESRIHLYA